MNLNKNEYNKGILVGRSYNKGAIYSAYNKGVLMMNLIDDFSTINKYWNYNIDTTREIVADITSATKPYAYNSVTKKWMVKNTDGDYEEYGVYEKVDSLDTVTKYEGKLVILSTDNHEYKWNGSEWEDLGTGSDVIPIGFISFNKNAVFDTGFNVLLNYNINNYLRVRHCAYMGYDYFYAGGGRGVGWFTVESYGGGVYDGYWNIANTTLFCNNSTVKKWSTDENGWSLITLNGNTLEAADSDGATYTGTWTGSLPDYTIKLCTSDYRADTTYTNSTGIFYNVLMWTSETDLAMDLYGSYKDGKCVVYDNVSKTYISNSWDGEPTFILTGELAVLPESYPEKEAPESSLTKSSYKEFLLGDYVNGLTITVYDKHYEVKDDKMNAPEYPFDFYRVIVSDYILNSDSTRYYLPNVTVHGIAIRTDYTDAGVCDMNFPHDTDYTGIIPRMSLNYSGGVYTDNSFTDRSLKSITDIVTIDGYEYYYYYFEDQSIDYASAFYSSTMTGASAYEPYVLLITSTKKD